MKINKLTINLVPSGNDGVEIPAAVLVRDADKQWTIFEEGRERGLYPYELELAYKLQTMIVNTFNGNRMKE